MTKCLSRKRELKHRHEVYGAIGEPLCWTCYSMQLAEIEDEEREERERIEELKIKHAGVCPVCLFHPALEVGVGDWSVGRTCPYCGYHDYKEIYAIYP